jgi:hypothetical protein
VFRFAEITANACENSFVRACETSTGAERSEAQHPVVIENDHHPTVDTVLLTHRKPVGIEWCLMFPDRVDDVHELADDRADPDETWLSRIVQALVSTGASLVTSRWSL